MERTSFYETLYKKYLDCTNSGDLSPMLEPNNKSFLGFHLWTPLRGFTMTGWLAGWLAGWLTRGWRSTRILFSKISFTEVFMELDNIKYKTEVFQDLLS